VSRFRAFGHRTRLPIRIHGMVIYWAERYIQIRLWRYHCVNSQVLKQPLYIYIYRAHYIPRKFYTASRWVHGTLRGVCGTSSLRYRWINCRYSCRVCTFVAACSCYLGVLDMVLCSWYVPLTCTLWLLSSTLFASPACAPFSDFSLRYCIKWHQQSEYLVRNDTKVFSLPRPQLTKMAGRLCSCMKNVLLHTDHLHVSATHVAIFRVVITRI